MELRKCECGNKDIRIEEFTTSSEELPSMLWHGYCQECHVSTVECFFAKIEAIQAWNEGKVE